MNCLKCGEAILSNHVQQGGCHMDCYEEYMNEEIMVWKVCLGSSCYYHEDSSIDLTCLADGETAQVARVKRIDLMNMEEFRGY